MEIDYTQWSLFTMCPAKFRYVYREHMKNAVGLAAKYSSELIHPSLAAWYMKTEPQWEQYWANYLKVGGPKAMMDEVYTLERAKVIYAKHALEYASDQEEYEVLHSEFTASIPIGKHRFISKPDLIVRRLEDGRVGVIDFKASGWAVGATLVPFDRQFLGQVKLTGASWMMKDHIFLGKAKTKTLEQNTQLTRDPVLNITPDVMDEWEQELKLELDWIEQCETTGVWPKHSPGSCNAYNMPCEFTSVCAAGKLRDVLIAQWEKVDPLEYLKHDG